MPELSGGDVERYTGGRLDKDDPETASLIARGYAAARRFCGWHVAPIKSEVLTLDGAGGRLLRLPTLRIVTLTSIVDDGDALVPADLYISKSGLVEKRTGGLWSTKLGSIVVTMEHGFDSAPDFDAAVLSWIDRASLAPAGGRARVVGPFQYSDEPMAANSTFTASERALLEMYRLERPA